MNQHLKRINELARKAKTVGLNVHEVKEQESLRKMYIETFRQQAHDVISNVKVIDPLGNDITPKKTNKNDPTLN